MLSNDFNVQQCKGIFSPVYVCCCSFFFCFCLLLLFHKLQSVIIYFLDIDFKFNEVLIYCKNIFHYNEIILYFLLSLSTTSMGSLFMSESFGQFYVLTYAQYFSFFPKHVYIILQTLTITLERFMQLLLSKKLITLCKKCLCFEGVHPHLFCCLQLNRSEINLNSKHYKLLHYECIAKPPLKQHKCM